MDSSEWDASTAVAPSGMDSTADKQLSVMTAAAVLDSPDCVGVILDFVGLDHFPVCAAVSRCFCACVQDKQELWNVLRPEHLISKNNSGLVEPCHAVAMGGDLIGVLDVGGSAGPRTAQLCETDHLAVMAARVQQPCLAKPLGPCANFCGTSHPYMPELSCYFDCKESLKIADGDAGATCEDSHLVHWRGERTDPCA